MPTLPEETEFTSDPLWLQSYKNQAAALLEKTPVPTEDQENWRYSDISNFRPDNFKPASKAVYVADTIRPEFLPACSAVIKLNNDGYAEKTDGGGKGGIRVINLAEDFDAENPSETDFADPSSIKDLVRKYLEPSGDDSFFELLAKAFVKTPILLYIPPNYKADPM